MKIKASLCVLASVSLLVISGCQNSMYMKDKEAMELSQIAAETPVPAPKPVPEPTRKEYSREEKNELTQEYKTLWQALDKKLESLDVSEDSNGVKRYSDNGVLKKLEIGQDTYGTKDLDFEREVYFENGAVYFVRLASNTGEMRLYFHGHQLIRWIDEKNNAYDSSEANSDFEVYEIKLLSEADRLAEEFEADQIIVNSYVTD